MIDRARPVRSNAPELPSLEALQQQLAIERDDLDTCLMDQPDLYYHVADALVTAIAKRDAAKLDLEQVTATLDADLRQKAAEAEEKITEASLQRKLATLPRIQALEKHLLHLRAEADRWQALKEAFQQRSFMLRELVAMLIARLGNLSLDRSVQSSHRDLADANHAAAGRMRQERRSQRG